MWTVAPDGVLTRRFRVGMRPMVTVRRPRLVLADDDEAMLALVVRMLEGRHCDVVGCAGNGREAVELVGALRADRVAMDVAMPVMDGLEATRRIRDRYPHVEIVGFSGSVPAETFMAAGASAAFSKPDITALVEHLARPLNVNA
jgi:CheY-like chemotaxis protein